MKQADLIKAVADHGGVKYPQSVVRGVLDNLADVAGMELSTGGEVPLLGLGKLVLHARSARTGRNPATGQTVEIPASNTVKFKVSSGLKNAVK